MEQFPSDLELTAASALLILSCKVFTSSMDLMSIMEEEEEENMEFERELMKKSDALESSSLNTIIDDSTTTSNSSLTTDESVQVQDHCVELMAVASTQCHEIRPKVARRARSKVIYRSSVGPKPRPKIWKNPNLNPKPSKVAESEITTTMPEGSCLSSGGSSEISSAGSGISKRLRKREGGGGERKWRIGEMKRRGVGSNHIRRRAEAIIRFLSAGGCASEVRIRQVLGDSPDTSKALRMLLRTEAVKRTGLGGRSDPFVYKVAAETEA